MRLYILNLGNLRNNLTDKMNQQKETIGNKLDTTGGNISRKFNSKRK